MKLTTLGALGSFIFSVSSFAQTNVLLAVFEGDVDALKIEAKEAPRSISRYRDRMDLSLLHLAAAMGNCDVMKVLVESGISVNQQAGSSGATPCHVAVRFGQLGALKWLVEKEADLSILNAQRLSILELALEMKEKQSPEETTYSEILAYLQGLENSPSKSPITELP